MVGLRARQRSGRVLGLASAQLASLRGGVPGSLGAARARRPRRRPPRPRSLPARPAAAPAARAGRPARRRCRVQARQRGLPGAAGGSSAAVTAISFATSRPIHARVAVAVKRRIGRHLGAVQRDHRQIHQPRRRAQPQPRHEQPLKRLLVIDDKPRDRRVIGHQPAADHPQRRVGTSTPPRSAGSSASRSNTRTAPARTSSPGHTAGAPARRPDGDATRPCRARRRRRSQTTPNAPHRATRACSPASRTTARARDTHTPASRRPTTTRPPLSSNDPLIRHHATAS